jgi:hypothetical protein
MVISESKTRYEALVGVASRDPSAGGIIVDVKVAA